MSQVLVEKDGKNRMYELETASLLEKNRKLRDGWDIEKRIESFRCGRLVGRYVTDQAKVARKTCQNMTLVSRVDQLDKQLAKLLSQFAAQQEDLPSGERHHAGDASLSGGIRSS